MEQNNPQNNFSNPTGQNPQKNGTVFGAITSAIWALTVLVYILVSFATGAWYITWVIFLIAVAIVNIVKAIMISNGGIK